MCLKLFDLYRYTAASIVPEVGRCNLNSVDPSLERDWFQTLTREYQSWFQNVPFKFNLHHYTQVVGKTPLMKGYFAGKALAEEALAKNFAEKDFLIVKPSFVYGGDEFSLSPPRVTKTYGDILVKLLVRRPPGV
jgi:hypothetical protein